MSLPNEERLPRRNEDRLPRRLGLGDAIFVGLASMLGAGVFAAIGPAAAVAGSGLLFGLLIAAVVAYANATSSAQLAAVYPEAGGTYVYGRERLGHFWGFLAGWGFVVGKTASLCAMALTIGAYAVPRQPRLAAVAAVAAVTGVNYLGVRKTAGATKAIASVVIASLLAVVVGALTGGTTSFDNLGDGQTSGILQSAGLLFFAFAGYARIATMGEEVKEPARNIPKAILTALSVALALYAAVAVSSLAAVGPVALAESQAPLVTAIEVGRNFWLAPWVRVGGAVAALGVLLSLQAGLSRTVLAMARNGELPRALAAIHPQRGIPHRAEIVVGLAVAAVVTVLDLRDAIGFSSLAVLAYYAIANAAAWTQPPTARRFPRWLQIVGFVGCTGLALSLPLGSVISGLAVLALGAAWWLVRRTLASP